MKETVIRLYKHYKEMMENPVGVDAVERKMCKEQCTKAFNDLIIKKPWVVEEVEGKKETKSKGKK